MIKLIYGGKGSGKTAALIEKANGNVDGAKGIHVYIDKNNARMHDLHHNVKLVDAKEYGIESETQFVSFVKGMVAVNYDIETIYVDNISKIVNLELPLMTGVFSGIEQISMQTGVDFVVTVLGEREELPTFLSKYLD